MTFEKFCNKIAYTFINSLEQPVPIEETFEFLKPYWEAEQKVAALELEIQHLKKVNKVQGLLLSVFRNKIKNLQNGK